MAFNPSSVSRLLVRATNWLGDALMSLPAIRCLRQVFPHAHIALVARPWVADLYARETSIDRVIPYPAQTGLRAKRAFAATLHRERFDAAILLQNAFDAALMVWLAGIPERIGYSRDGRGLLLTRAVPVPEPGDIPRHERFYYLELLRRAGLVERFPETGAIRLDGIDQARRAGKEHLRRLDITCPVIGISPGAAYGTAKRWIPERFAAVAQAFPSASVLIFGSSTERDLCGTVATCLRSGGVCAQNLAGQTTLREFIDLAAVCRLFLTNDSGAMHVASALGVPTVAVFGATDDATTGPTGPLARVVREHAECSPCLLRDCPIDHRCMTAVTAERAAAVALELWEESAPAWTHEAKS
ncbi:MAG TPA: lipopolysaccharide heptosyltransferase II [Bryobacteraceae bacterium]|nr:lipopolysaccharide heptosyltransferase II [Bryobacteraceae bacterium]